MTEISFLLLPLNTKHLELFAELLPEGSALLNVAMRSLTNLYMQINQKLLYFRSSW